MKKYKLTMIILLLGLPLASLLYKSFGLDMPMVPKQASNYWKVELSLNEAISRIRTADAEAQSLVLPLPENGKYQLIKNLEIDGRDPKHIDAEIEGKDVIDMQRDDGTLKYKVVSFQAHPRQSDYFKSGSKEPLSTFEKSELLKMSDYSEEEIILLQKLVKTLVFSTDSQLDQIEKFFYYLADEISLKHDLNKISDVVNFSAGSYLAQARSFVGLARLVDIPARIMFGVKFLEPKPGNEVRYTRVFMAEAYVNDRWVPFLPEGRINGEFTGQQLVLCRTCGSHAMELKDKNLVSVIVNPVKYDPISSEEQIEHLNKISPFWAWMSLHRLPLSLQAILLGIILVPFGTIALSFSRVILGIETFGIFMPILLALFFLETSLAFGLMLFTLVVVLGLAQRYVLDRFYLLAVPRLSILVSCSIMVYLLFAVMSMKLDILADSQSSLSYFPIVIITVFIEKLSVTYQEEGGVNTIKIAINTFLVSTLCYVLLDFDWLEMFLFNNPEVILFSIGMNMLIGSYKGFRLLEILRFSSINEQSKISFK